MQLTLDEALEKGVEAHRAGQIQEADKFYTAILQAQPNHPHANHNMGILAVGLGKTKEALPFFEAALEENRKIDHFWLSYVDALIELGLNTKAATVLVQAKEYEIDNQTIEQLEKKLFKSNASNSLKPNSAVAFDAEPKLQDPKQAELQHIIDYYHRGQFKLTLDLATEMLEKYPRSARLYNICGASHGELQQFDAAVGNYQQAINIRPDFSPSYNNLANVLQAQGNLDEAITSYKKAAEYNPHSAETYNNLGCALLKKGDLNAAISYFNHALKIDPSFAEAYCSMGNALKASSNPEAAIQNYKKAIHIRPDYADAYYNLGVTLQENGQLDDALDSHSHALKFKSNFADAHNSIGIILQEKGAFDAAIDSYRQAINLKADFAEAYNNMGNVLRHKGELESAITCFNRALEIKPDYSQVYNNKGLALYDKGDLAGAIKCYENAIAITPDLAEAYNNMGNALKDDKGDLDAAIVYYKRALAIKPDYADCYVNLYSLGLQVSDSGIGVSDIDVDSDFRHILSQSPKHNIYQSINHFIEGNLGLSKSCLGKYDNIVQSKKAKYSNRKDEVFCNAYFKFLSSLVKKTSIPVKTNNSKIYHIGESHCLSYAHSVFVKNSLAYSVVPRITFGAKAYHYSDHANNSFKVITKMNLARIPHGSIVFVSVGEIDCRANEGIIKAVEKTESAFNEVVNKTIDGYVSWFVSENISHQHLYYFFNVPAPAWKENQSATTNTKRADVVLRFNTALKKKLLSLDLAMIDVYKHTKDNKGFSNNLFHCDGTHLDQRIVHLIQEQLTD
jgi:tetratricopeptide (TPR) repeat protein